MRSAVLPALLAVLACGPSTLSNPSRHSVLQAYRQPSSACSDDVVREAFGATVSLSGRITARDSSVVLPAAFADSMYRVLANRRVRVEELGAPAMVRFEFTVDRDGVVGDSIMPRYAGPVWFAEEVIGALASAVLTRSVPRMPRELEGSAIPLVMEVRTAPVEPGWSPFPLRIALDSAKVDAYAIAAPGNKAPRYPSDLLSRGIGGDVIVRLIVEPNGRANMSSLTPVLVTDPGFLHAVVEHLREFRYFTAILGGCAVPAWTDQPFSFRVGRSRPH